MRYRGRGLQLCPSLRTCDSQWVFTRFTCKMKYGFLSTV